MNRWRETEIFSIKKSFQGLPDSKFKFVRLDHLKKKKKHLCLSPSSEDDVLSLLAAILGEDLLLEDLCVD